MLRSTRTAASSPSSTTSRSKQSCRKPSGCTWKKKMDKGQKFYITTPIYYVNARPHIGHAYTTLVCDAIARRKRMLGVDTFFLTGTDEHGVHVERSATAAQTPPQEWVDKVSAEFRSLFDRMNISYDDFIRTTEPRHQRSVQELFRRIKAKDFIYKGTYT